MIKQDSQDFYWIKGTIPTNELKKKKHYTAFLIFNYVKTMFFFKYPGCKFILENNLLSFLSFSHQNLQSYNNFIKALDSNKKSNFLKYDNTNILISLNQDLEKEYNYTNANIQFLSLAKENTYICRIHRSVDNIGIINFILNNINNNLTLLAKILKFDVYPPNISLCSQLDKNIIHNLNNTDYKFKKVDIIEKFIRTTKLFPNKIAIIDSLNIYSYRELDHFSNQLANCLKEKFKNKKITAVALHVKQSYNMIAVLLSLLKLGIIFVPINVNLKLNQKIDITNQANISHIINDTNFLIPKKILININDLIINAQNFSNKFRYHKTEDVNIALHYLFTSGSTGKPKGVVSRQICTMNRLYYMLENLPFSKSDVQLLTSKLTFIPAIWQIFGPLLSGSKLAIPLEEDLFNINKLISFIKKTQATRIMLVPDFLYRLLESSTKDQIIILNQIKLWIVSGSHLNKLLFIKFKKLIPHAKLIVMYGSTEAEDVSYFDTDNLLYSTENISVGKPIANIKTCILDQYHREIPIGYFGKLFISSKFIPNTYLSTENNYRKLINNKTENIYDTYDIARYLPDGNIEIMGRTDSIIKINGLRINLIIIENYIRQFPFISEAIVYEYDKTNSPTILISFIKKNKEFDLKLKKKFTDFVNLEYHGLNIYHSNIFNKYIQNFIRKKLTESFIPKLFFFIDDFPLLPNNKINRRFLKESLSSIIEKTKLIHCVNTNNELEYIENKLFTIWKHILSKNNFTIKENFFDIGGDSLAAMGFLAAASKAGIEMNFAEFIQNPTIESISFFLKNRFKSSISSQTITIKKSDSEESHLYLLPPGGGLAFPYLNLKHHLSSNFSVYALNNPTFFNKTAFTSIEQISQYHYNQIINSNIQNKKIFLGGWSYGGIIALEIARLYKSFIGKYPDCLVLIDSFIGDHSKKSKTNQKAEQKNMLDNLNDAVIDQNTNNQIKQNLVLSGKFLAKYNIRPYDGKILYIYVEDSKVNRDFLKHNFPNITFALTKGKHGNLFDPVNIEELANNLDKIVQI